MFKPSSLKESQDILERIKAFTESVSDNLKAFQELRDELREYLGFVEANASLYKDHEAC